MVKHLPQDWPSAVWDLWALRSLPETVLFCLRSVAMARFDLFDQITFIYNRMYCECHFCLGELHWAGIWTDKAQLIYLPRTTPRLSELSNWPPSIKVLHRCWQATVSSIGTGHLEARFDFIPAFTQLLFANSDLDPSLYVQ